MDLEFVHDGYNLKSRINMQPDVILSQTVVMVVEPGHKNLK